MADPTTIQLILRDGTADGVIKVELDNWNGKVVKIPRAGVEKYRDTDSKSMGIEGTGVYFLFCRNKDTIESVYIGESIRVHQRLLSHIREYASETEQFYWNSVVVFTGKGLDKAGIWYLEKLCVKRAREIRRYEVLTEKTHDDFELEESRIVALNRYFANMQIVLNALGYKVFEPFIHIDDFDNEKLYIHKGNVNAIGQDTDEGFLVFSGATISEKVAPKSVSASTLRLRKQMEGEGKVKNNITTEDIVFTSPSAAADFLKGYSVSGPLTWVDKSGKSLKEKMLKE